MHQEDITVVTIYEPKIGAATQKAKLTEILKGQINCNIIVVRKFILHCQSRINKETVDINNTTNYLYPTDIYRSFY